MEKGVPLGFVHDSLSSAQAGLKTTGHAFPGTPAVYGPSTANLVMQPGDTSLEEIIKGVEKGILATRLHYVRCLNDKEALVGGVTSNGTFLIKDGRIVHPVKPMRFTTRLVDGMLKNISAVTGERLTMIRTAQGPTSVSLYSSAHTLPGVRSDAWQLRKTD
jgi:predicted Zn-dependent protease